MQTLSFILTESGLLLLLAFVFFLLNSEERQAVLKVLAKSLIIAAMVLFLIWCGSEILKACL